MYIHNVTCHSTLVEKAKYLCQTVTQCRLVLVLCAGARGAAAADCAQWTVGLPVGHTGATEDVEPKITS